jgi:hypothetical protein
MMVTNETFKSATTTASPLDDSPYAPSYAELDGTAEIGRKSGAREGDGESEVDPRKSKKTAVARAGIEPATHGFSVRCSTN